MASGRPLDASRSLIVPSQLSLARRHPPLFSATLRTTLECLGGGQIVPSASLLDLAAGRRVEVLGLSVTLPAHLGAVHVLIGEARARGLGCKILVGGGALARAPALAAALGADGAGADARAANALCRGRPI